MSKRQNSINDALCQSSFGTSPDGSLSIPDSGDGAAVEGRRRPLGGGAVGAGAAGAVLTTGHISPSSCSMVWDGEKWVTLTKSGKVKAYTYDHNRPLRSEKKRGRFAPRRDVISVKNDSVTIGAVPIDKKGATVPRPHVLHEVLEGETVPYTILSEVHNPADVGPSYVYRDEGSVEIWVGAALVKASRPPLAKLGCQGTKRKKTTRGKVTGFSRKSRRRMTQAVAKVQTAKLPLFLTLTYPGTNEGQIYKWMSDAHEWKRHLEAFVKRLRRRWRGAAGFWKLEPQKRGAPHFHLMLWGVSAALAEVFEQWAKRAWYEIVGSGDVRHLKHGADCKPVQNQRGTMFYASKYMGKPVKQSDDIDPTVWDFPGRWWGVIASADVPWGEKFTTKLRGIESTLFIRTMRKYVGKKWRGRHITSTSIFVNNATWWAENLDKLTGYVQ